MSHDLRDNTLTYVGKANSQLTAVHKNLKEKGLPHEGSSNRLDTFLIEQAKELLSDDKPDLSDIGSDLDSELSESGD